MDHRQIASSGARARWVWVVLALVAGVAVWHALDFESDPDGEYPAIQRPTYSAFPPAAYRLAEPGDTLDRVSLYLAGLLVVGSALGIAGSGRGRRSGWVAALAGSLIAWWYAATPGPSPDGWHGLGWRVIVDPLAPAWLRLELFGALVALGLVIVVGLVEWARGPRAGTNAWDQTVRRLLYAAAGLLVLRLADPSMLEPVGYWSRWALVLACLAATLALGLRLAQLAPAVRRSRRLVAAAAGLVAAVGLVGVGLGTIEYHRPIPRLKAVVPGKIYMSAMPDYRGLELAHGRHGFRTIINLFPEDTPQRSRLWPQELAFVEDHPSIRYLRSPGGEDDNGAFLDETLAAARDPSAWPILVHCHGCMDRTPAWVGIYRFVVEGQSLAAVYREIEAHRGYRPKASVSLLFNHVLPRLAPERWKADPLSNPIAELVRGVPDPYRREPGAAEACPPAGSATARREPGTSVQ